MKHFIRLTDYSAELYIKLFQTIQRLEAGGFANILKGKTVVLFFPSTSIRTRVTFEKAIHQLGGQVVLFSSDTLDKKEEIQDVLGYLENWADCLVVRHRNIDLLESMVAMNRVPLINAMTHANHPCEILSDLYALSQMRTDWRQLKYTFVGEDGNIGLAWAEAVKVFGLDLVHCSPEQYAMKGIPHVNDIEEGVRCRDIILTDSISAVKEDFMPYQITIDLMDTANSGALLNPCPPFTRGEEVSAEVIDSPYFVGYGFKKTLLVVQQAILICFMGLDNGLATAKWELSKS